MESNFLIDEWLYRMNTIFKTHKRYNQMGTKNLNLFNSFYSNEHLNLKKDPVNILLNSMRLSVAIGFLCCVIWNYYGM